MKNLLGVVLISMCLLGLPEVGQAGLSEQLQNSDLCLAVKHQVISYGGTVEQIVVCNQGALEDAGFKITNFLILFLPYQWGDASRRKVTRQMGDAGFDPIFDLQNDQAGVTAVSSERIDYTRVLFFAREQSQHAGSAFCLFKKNALLGEVSKDLFEKKYGGHIFCDQNRTIKIEAKYSEEELSLFLGGLGYSVIEDLDVPGFTTDGAQDIVPIDSYQVLEINSAGSVASPHEVSL